MAIVFAVLTISDTCHQDADKDRSGPRLMQLIKIAFQNTQVRSDILPDECEIITEKLRELIGCQEQPVSVIITTGGTGFAPRDVTPEATKQVLNKECPQLSMAIALASLKKTKYAALTRGVCGIASNTLILNFPGSEKAVIECFEVVRELLPHALHLIGNKLSLVQEEHAELPQQNVPPPNRHICPHKTRSDDAYDRNSPFDMISVAQALELIFQTVRPHGAVTKHLEAVAEINIPPFRASIKDGYAMKSCGFAGSKKVIGCISAGDEPKSESMLEDECFKINTGAPLPDCADCVVQVEDTKLLKSHKDGSEDLVEILVEPKADLDIRPIGCDLSKGSKLFPQAEHSDVILKSIFASMGKTLALRKPKIAIVSTGCELLEPQHPVVHGKIYDSNSTMLFALLQYFGFDCEKKSVLSDNFEELKKNIETLFENVDFVICSGGVSMGDKDYVKPVLQQLEFDIKFGRVNVKPGKPMTYATDKNNKHFFGLPGNPVSAFVTFHLFALPALRYAAGWARDKCELSNLQVILENETIGLDARPEYMRASLTSRSGRLYAAINGNQMSSRLQSIVGADVLVHLPPSTVAKPFAHAGDLLTASVLRYDFISKYE